MLNRCVQENGKIFLKRLYYVTLSTINKNIWKISTNIGPWARPLLNTGHLARCPLQTSVSRFQEKEKRGEMITKNDNIK
jgi:hypothetical protein